MKIYIPNVKTEQPIYADTIVRRKGIGLPTDHVVLEDVGRLGCTWYYNWGITANLLSDPRYVPMSWSGSKGILPIDYAGYLLVFNEPDNPDQTDLAAPHAANRLLSLAKQLPKAKIIAGGITQWGTDYLEEFNKCLGSYRPHGYHVHGYVYPGTDFRFLKEWWFPQVQRLCTGEIWVSEFADVVTNTNELIDYVVAQSWITRYAWFANRMDGDEWWYPKDWPRNPSLIDLTGNITKYGTLYKSL